MALNKQISLNGNVNLEDNGIGGVASVSVSDLVYIKVTNVNASKENAIAHVLFTSENITGERRYSFQVNLDGDNFIKQAYNHLKTLPEFSGATDV